MNRLHPEEPITPENAGLAARDLIARLVEKWRSAGLPALGLAEALIQAGVGEIVRARGPAGAAAALLNLAEEFSAASGRRTVQDREDRQSAGG
jgi:hypothetical protein